MTDTVRTLADIQALLADNTRGDISPQDLRDAIISLGNQYGQLSETGNVAATVISDTISYFEVTLTTPTLGQVSQLQGSADFDQPAAGRLRYLGTPARKFAIICSLSLKAAVNKREIHLALGKTGTPDTNSEQRRWLADNDDVGSTALSCIADLATNQYISLFAKNITGVDNVTIVSFNLNAIGMIS